MIGGKHLQRGTDRMLTCHAFFTEAGTRIFIAALIFQGDRLLAKPDIELMYLPAHGSIEDVVIARMVRYLNDTTFGEGTQPEKRFDWTDYGPWK